MADEPENSTPEEKKEFQETSTPPKVEIDETELEAVKGKSAKYEELEAVASDLGFGTVDEYVEFLEADKYDRVTKKETTQTDVKPPQKPATTPQPKPEAQTQPTPQPDNRMVEMAYLEAQYSQYTVKQMDTPKDERPGYTKTDLMNVMKTKRAAVYDLVKTDKTFEGNLFAAAEFLLNLPKATATARKKGEDEANALTAAKETAKIEGETPPPTKTEEPSDNEKLANEIAPDDKYVYPG